MSAWKAYAWEHATWPQFESVRCDEATTRKLIKKFSRHFKLPGVPHLDFTKRKGGAAKTWVRMVRRKSLVYDECFGLINVPPETNLGVVVHEFAHIMADWKNGRYCHHDRRFKRQLKRTYTWAKRYLPKAA